ncbi:MAG: hypothetical protein U5K54_15400 [Cytophagales bacterium]|nr:hypothetical protein [Cytophagales bacterium]
MNGSPLRVEKTENQETKGKTTKEKVEKTFTEEIIIGICAPIGSLKDEVINDLSNQLKNIYKYDVHIISLSDLILEYYKEPFNLIKGKTDAFAKLTHKINGGNHLRTKYNDHSVLAELAIKTINLCIGQKPFLLKESHLTPLILSQEENAI